MRIFDYIFRKVSTNSTIRNWQVVPFQMMDGRRQYADLVFANICELLTDIAQDVEWRLKPTAKGKAMDFAEFKTFFRDEAQRILNLLFLNGFVVVRKGVGFSVAERDTYHEEMKGDIVRAVDVRTHLPLYVLKSPTYQVFGKSDYVLLRPWLDYLNNTLDASYTVGSRLGSLVVMSPKTVTGMPTAFVLTEDRKKELEKQIAEEYGALRKQKNVMVLPAEMNIETLNLAGLDQRTLEKVRLAVAAICDRIKVPANQVVILEADTTKSLSNGSELRAGDLMKYKSFERLLDRTFCKMAADFEIPVDYEIYNKPAATPAQKV